MSARSECFCWRKKLPEMETLGLHGLRLESHLGDFLNNFELAFKEGLNVPLISEDGRWRLRNLGKILEQFNERTSYNFASGLQGKELDRSITVKYKLHLVQQGRQKKVVVVTCGNSIEHRTKNRHVKIFLPRRWREPVLNGKKYEDTSSLDPNDLFRQQSGERNPTVKSCAWFSESKGLSICTTLKLDYDSKETVVVDHVHCSTLVMQLTASFSGVDLMLHNSHECEFTPTPAYVGVKKSEDECKLASLFPHISSIMPSVYATQRCGGSGFGDDYDEYAWIPDEDDDEHAVNDAGEGNSAPNGNPDADNGNDGEDADPEEEIPEVDAGANPNDDDDTSDDDDDTPDDDDDDTPDDDDDDTPEDDDDTSDDDDDNPSDDDNDTPDAVAIPCDAPNDADDGSGVPGEEIPEFARANPDCDVIPNDSALCYVCFKCSGKSRPRASGCSYCTGYYHRHGYFECVERTDCAGCPGCEPSGTCQHCTHFGHGYGNRVWRFSYADNKYDFYDIFDSDRQLRRMKMKSSVQFRDKKPKQRGKDKQKRCPRQFGEAKYFRDDFDEADDEYSATVTTKRGGSSTSCRRRQL